MADNPDTNSATSARSSRAWMRAAFLDDYSAAVEMASGKFAFRYQAPERELLDFQRRARIVLDGAPALEADGGQAHDSYLAIGEINAEISTELADRQFIEMDADSRTLALEDMETSTERYELAGRLHDRAGYFYGDSYRASQLRGTEYEQPYAQAVDALAHVQAGEETLGGSVLPSPLSFDQYGERVRQIMLKRIERDGGLERELAHETISYNVALEEPYTLAALNQAIVRSWDSEEISGGLSQDELDANSALSMEIAGRYVAEPELRRVSYEPVEGRDRGPDAPGPRQIQPEAFSPSGPLSQSELEEVRLRAAADREALMGVWDRVGASNGGEARVLLHSSTEDLEEFRGQLQAIAEYEEHAGINPAERTRGRVDAVALAVGDELALRGMVADDQGAVQNMLAELSAQERSGLQRQLEERLTAYAGEPDFSPNKLYSDTAATLASVQTIALQNSEEVIASPHSAAAYGSHLADRLAGVVNTSPELADAMLGAADDYTLAAVSDGIAAAQLHASSNMAQALSREEFDRHQAGLDALDNLQDRLATAQAARQVQEIGSSQTHAERGASALAEHTRLVEAAGGARAFAYETHYAELVADRDRLSEALAGEIADHAPVEPDVASAIETEISEIDRELTLREFANDMHEDPEATLGRMSPAEIDQMRAAVRDHQEHYSSIEPGVSRVADAGRANLPYVAEQLGNGSEVPTPARDAYFEARAQAGAVGMALHDPKNRDALKLGDLYDQQHRLTAQLEAAGKRPGFFRRAERSAYDREHQRVQDELASIELPIDYLEARLGPDPVPAVQHARALVKTREQIFAKTGQLQRDAIDEEIAREPEWLTNTLGQAQDAGPNSGKRQALAGELAANRLRYAVTDDADPGIRPNQTMLSDKVAQFAIETGVSNGIPVKPDLGLGL